MKLIPLTKGKWSIVDDEDYDNLKDHNWHAIPSRETFYATRANPRTFPNGRKFKPVYEGPSTTSIHRQIFGIKDPKIQVDHIDGDGLNNQKSNLRLCTAAQNQFNSKKQSGCSSRFKGVSWSKHAKKWKASFGPTKSRFCLGYCDTEKEAALLYNVAASFQFREFAKLNEV